MALKVAEKKIGGKLYRYQSQPLTPAWEILALVARLVGDSASRVASLWDAEVSGTALEALVKSLFDRVGDSVLGLDLIKRLNAGGTVTMNGGKTVVVLKDDDIAEMYFAEHFEDLAPWVGFALDAQLRPFLNSVPSLLGLDAEKMAKMKAMASSFMSRTASDAAGSSSGSSPSA